MALKSQLEIEDFGVDEWHLLEVASTRVPINSDPMLSCMMFCIASQALRTGEVDTQLRLVKFQPAAFEYPSRELQDKWLCALYIVANIELEVKDPLWDLDAGNYVAKVDVLRGLRIRIMKDLPREIQKEIESGH